VASRSQRSKTIERHPKVAEVEYAADGDVSSKYLVHLKPGWWFPGYRSGTRGFATVADFTDATRFIEQRTDGR